ncbi:MAG: methylenetetrahydrofolate reductase [Gammaproteobacteria bacterium]|nr:methylenetetrahydrofolate reductase [Gammaproteobacteria bacterium]
MDATRGLRALANPRFEVIPVRGVLGHAAGLPPGAHVTVTCSPKLGLERTLETSEALLGMGFRVIPHLPARLVRDRGHLREVLVRLREAGLREVFVVGGDAPEPVGGFRSGYELLEALATFPDRPERIGIPCYPEGHPLIDAALLAEALRAKASHADYMVTQICFDPGRILDWLRATRNAGIHLPVHFGLPGVMASHKLLSIALKIGLGDSTRLLRRRPSTVGRLLAGDYDPATIVRALLEVVADPALDVAGFHFNTFNAVSSLERWRARMLDEVSRRCALAPPAAAGATAESY